MLACRKTIADSLDTYCARFEEPTWNHAAGCGCSLSIHRHEHARFDGGKLCTRIPTVLRRVRIDSRARVTILRIDVPGAVTSVPSRLPCYHTYASTTPRSDLSFCQYTQPHTNPFQPQGKRSLRVFLSCCPRSRKCSTCQRGRRDPPVEAALGTLCSTGEASTGDS